ncbi:hypothetical protein N0V83_001943 [Neocucurbitaria cava]|uniref:Uncharacterized protein n=1 Tax=Neocucurbitaria cava TaxID=798079 RepID=A0A9W8YG31_9PLEO|nr:hypothetical protein N0V83_001943 [Neocucurbitaria cava]
MEETIAAVIEGAVIIVYTSENTKYLRAFLDRAPGRYGVVRQLNFNSFSRCSTNVPVNQDLELAVRCTGLRTITLILDDENLTLDVFSGDGTSDDGTSDGPVLIPMKPEDLYANFELERLLDCNLLSKIIIEHCNYTSVAEDVVIELGQMLRQAITKKGTRQTVEILRHYGSSTHGYGLINDYQKLIGTDLALVGDNWQ